MSDTQRLPPIAVTPEQAAQMLCLHRTTIYQLMASGELPSFRAGRARRIRVTDIEAWAGAAVAREASSGRLAYRKKPA